MRQVKVGRKPYLFEESFTVQHLAFGLSIGTGIGIVAGLAIGNVALGLSLGAGMGLSIGMLIDSTRQHQKD